MLVITRPPVESARSNISLNPLAGTTDLLLETDGVSEHMRCPLGSIEPGERDVQVYFLQGEEAPPIRTLGKKRTPWVSLRIGQSSVWAAVGMEFSGTNRACGGGPSVQAVRYTLLLPERVGSSPRALYPTTLAAAMELSDFDTPYKTVGAEGLFPAEDWPRVSCEVGVTDEGESVPILQAQTSQGLGRSVAQCIGKVLGKSAEVIAVHSPRACLDVSHGPVHGVAVRDGEMPRTPRYQGRSRK